MKKLPNLNPLRFILVSIVIIYHIPQLCQNQGLPYYFNSPIFNRGVEAVYMFFVLSGFLIIRLIYKSKINNTFSIKKFYMRRILRILPLYYLIVIFGFVFYHKILPFLNIPFANEYDLKTGILMNLFFIPNIFFHYKPGGILEVLWSIGIEEQFYLMIAPLFYFIKKDNIFITLLIVTLVYFTLFHLNSLWFLKKYSFVYFFMLSGGIIAILEEKKKLEFIKKSKFVPPIVLTLVVVFFITDFLQFKNLIMRNLFITILFSLFVYSISHTSSIIEIKSKFINYLGKISYGIYMYHVIALNIVVFSFQSIQQKYNFNSIITIILIHILTFVLTIIFAHFSYKYFELPFLKLKEKYNY
ncbi:MAG: acyltransferase [Flavobacteriaceae bacterium]|nr:acyltransferase [Flavobacteriaceae bacterium]